jgi:methyl-accepting chemotaxis protein
LRFQSQGRGIKRETLKPSIIGKAAQVSANEKMGRLKSDYGYYEDLLLADAQGKIIASSNKATIGKINVNDRAYFKSAMDGQPFVSDVAVSRSSGNPVIFIAAPVVDKNQVKGVLAGVVNIASFSSQFIDSIKTGQTGYAYLFNKSGILIAHPDKSKIMKENIGDLDFGKQMLAQKNGLIIYTYEGIKNEAAFNTIAGQEWIVAVNVPEAEIMAPVKSLGRINLLVAATVIAIATVLIFLLPPPWSSPSTGWLPASGIPPRATVI